MKTIFQAPFIWIKAWNKNCGKTLTWHCCMCCNPANGRVDFEEWSAYKIQLLGIEWIVSLSADWDQNPITKKSLLMLFLLKWGLVVGKLGVTGTGRVCTGLWIRFDPNEWCLKNGLHSGGLNPGPLGHESSALTTRPRLLQKYNLNMSVDCYCQKNSINLFSNGLRKTVK